MTRKGHARPDTTPSAEARFHWTEVLPEARAALLQLEAAAHATGLNEILLELVKARVSQINGCGYCLDMHTKNARLLGEREQRLYALTLWAGGSLLHPGGTGSALVR